MSRPDAPSGPFRTDEIGEGYRRLFAALPLPAVVLDLAGFIRLANREASDFLGLSSAAWLQQRSMLQLLGAEDRQRLVWRLADPAGQDVLQMRDVQVRPEVSRTVACDLHLVRLPPGMTHQPMTLCLLVDRSLEAELRASQDRLRQQRQRLGDAIWASQSGFWEWDLRSQAIVVNERFAQILGYSHADMQDMSSTRMLTLLHPDDRQRMRQLIAELRDSADASFNERQRLNHHDGSWVWVTNRGRVFEWDDDDQPIRLGGTIHDVSQDVEREEALRVAKERAEASERMRSAWLANVGHEIRTPLNSLLGLVQLMQEETHTPHQQQQLERLEESARLLRSTLDDLLDNAKLEAGQMRLERLPVSTPELADSVMSVFGHEADRRGLQLRCTTHPRVPPVLMGDPLRLRQVINNLVSNALKFTLQGGVEVQFDAQPDHGGQGCRLRVSVADTGIGIEAPSQGRLFAPFFQADASTTRQFGGTGLGLSICRRLVELMGGQIGVDSEPGRGSRFWFTAMLAMPQPDEDARPRTAATGPTSPLGRAQHADTPLVADTPSTLAADPRLLDLQQHLLLHDLRAIAVCEDLLAQARGSERQMLLKMLMFIRDFEFDNASGVLSDWQSPRL